MSGYQRQSFEFNDSFTGYLVYLRFVKCISSSSPKENTLENLYKLLYQESKDIESASSFIRVFQFIQIKSYSEATCETIGSIMKIHGGTSRNLHIS